MSKYYMIEKEAETLKKVKNKNPLVHIIDDDNTLLEAYKRALEKQGYDVTGSNNATDGLIKVEKQRPDLVFVDVGLDKDDGIEVMKQIKSDESLQDIFVVLISGNEVSAESVSGGLNTGADDYLIKPLTSKELQAHVDKLMRWSRTIDKLSKAERRFSKLIHQNADAIIVLSKDGAIRFANPAAEKLFNMNAEELRGFVFGLPTSVDKPTDVAIPSQNGEDMIVEMNVVEENWDTEEAYIATLRDVTERKQTLPRVKQLNSLLQAISEINQLIAIEKDIPNLFKKSGEILLKTRSYNGITVGLIDESGYIQPVTTKGDHHFPGKWFITAKGKGEAPDCIKKAIKERKMQILEEGDETCQECSYTTQHIYGFYQVIIAPIFDNNQVVGIMAVTIKEAFTTEEERKLLNKVAENLGMGYAKKRVEAELESSEQNYKELFENSPGGIFQTTYEGNLLNLNSEMARILDINDPVKAIEHYNDLKNQLYANPWDRDEFVRLIQEKGRVDNFEFKAVSAKGKVRWVKLSAKINRKYSNGSFLIDGFVNDITREREAQRKLEESEQRFRTVYESSPVGIKRLSPDMNILDANEEYCNFTGYTKEKLRDKSIRELIWHEDEEEYTKYMKQLLRGKKDSFEMEKRFIRSDGQVVWGLDNVSLIRDTEGKPLYFLGNVIDIDQRKKAEEKLIETREQAEVTANKFRALVEQSSEMLWLHDKSGQIIEVNRTAEEATGFSREELYTMNIVDLAPSVNDKDLNKFSRSISIEDPAVTSEIDYSTKNNNVYPAEMVISKIELENKEYLLALVRDITQRKRAENELIKTNTILQQSEEISNVGGFELDAKAQQFTTSEGFQRIHGLTKKIYSLDELWPTLYPDDISKVEEAMDKAFKNIKPYDIEHRIIRLNDKQVRTVKASGRVKFDNKGNPLKMYGATQDITEQKQAENELLKAKEQAEESERLKTAFLTNMSHEIRTPMNAIVGFSDMLNDPDIDEEERGYYAGVIQNKADMLLQLITDIVDISKMDSGRLEVNPKQIEVNKFMAEVHSISQVTLKNEKKEEQIDLRIYKEQPGEEVKMMIDSGRLSQVIDNLVANAIKYTPEGYVEIGYTTGENQISFYVKDNGNGISEEDQKIIFDRFRRGSSLKDPKTNELYRGTGLGLNIASELTRLMKGEISLDSEPGKGSVFYVSFPWEHTQDENEQKVQRSQENQSTFRNKKFLVVEDDQDNMEYLKILFKKTDATLLAVETGEKAIEVCKENNPDLVLMDIKLPGMDGYEATQKIKELNPEIPVIAQTAHAMAEDKQKALNSGCDDYISKPVKRTELFPRITKVLSS